LIIPFLLLWVPVVSVRKPMRLAEDCL